MQRLQLGKKIARKAAGIMMALILMLPLNSVTSLAATNHITANAPDAIELSAGEQYSLTLSNVFTDAEGHTMTYSISNDSGNKSTANQKNGVYYFTSPEAGKYNPIITAECSDGSQKTVQLNITVSVGEVHDINQYGYDETPADEVTVYVTISNDGIPLRGNDAAGTALAHLTVTVPYFDLENYDLQDYYRYPTENGMGSYNGDQVIERPTAMHLFIYMLERYYMGLPAAECGTGEHKDKLFGKAEGAITDILEVNSPEPSGNNLSYSGGSTSTFMENFWGHDLNLMYYRNHRYPLMSEGWGATSDYMLLSDGDAIDLAMFSNWSFYNYGKFLSVTTPNGTLPVETLTVNQGEGLHFSALQYGTQSVTDGGTDNFERVPEDDDLTYFLLTEKGEWIDTVYSEQEYDESGNFTGNYVIGAESLSALKPGTYKLFSMDITSGDNEEACTAPATCDLIIKATGDDEPEGDDSYELRIVDFEGDYWDALIDEPQYGGPLLYGDNGAGFDAETELDRVYKWIDEKTSLSGTIVNGYGSYCYWSGGEAVSNYASGDIEGNGDYESQLTVYLEGENDLVRTGGGHKGSDNFAVHYGYADTSGWGLTEASLPRLTFTDGKTHVIDHMYIKLTDYLLNCITNGNDLTAAMGDNDVIYVRAIGYDASNKKVSEVSMNVCEGTNLIVKDWTKWDLSGLGSVASAALELNGSSDNGYGFSQPAYFAYDDVAVRFQKSGSDPVEEPEETSDWSEDGEYTGEESTETIPVKLIIPEGSEAQFFVGTEGSGQIVKATDLGVDESNAQIHRYEITVPDGPYSCMVSDSDHNYGGVGFDVPLQTSIYEETNLTLALVKFYTTTTSVKIDGVETPVTIDSADDFTVNLAAPGKAVIIPGENYSDTTIKAGETYMVAPRMVWAYGNQILYNYTVELGDDLSTNMGVSPQINQTFESKITAIQKKTFSVAALKTFTLTAPTAADTVFYYQINNFNDMVLEGNDRVKSVDNGDGTTTYTVYYPAFSNASYRITEDGYVTAAGYAKDNGAYTVTTDEAAVEADAANKTRTVFLFREDPDGSLAESTETEIASKAGAGSNIEYENSVYLNIDDSKDTNELSLAEGGKFRLRAYRAAWEIVNTVTANIMIEPDFHYEVLYGSDVVSVTPVTSQCTGNAKGNWLDLKAENPGQALIAVWYDAIDVSGNTTLFGTYGATDPARYGYVLVNVGEDYTVDWNVVSHDGDWDAEFDTVYYYGDNGILTIAPEGATSVTVSNVNATDLASAQSVEANDDGSYDVPVQSGSNLITVTTAGGTDYMLVRAKQISYYIENVTTGKNSNTDEDFIISLGDRLKIHFDQFNMPIAKMSGIYNPGYMGTAKTMFTLNGQYSLSSVGTQYDYITDEKSCITLTAWVPGENVLSGGFIQSGSMGDNFGNHRNTGDAGRGTNFSAVNVTGYFGSIEDITFNVQDSDAVMDTSSLTALKSGSIFVGESTYNNAGTFTISKTTGVNNYTQWTKTTSAMASQPKNFSLKANVVTQDYYSTLELRYWYDGEEVHTASMIAGSDTIIPWSEFPHDADKILNVQVVVTPGNPELSEAAVYSFLWLPGNANLQYVHPVIKNMTVTAGEETLVLTSEAGEGILYTVTDYELETNGAESITLNTEMLQKYKNATKNTQDKADTVTVQKYLEGEAAGEAVEVYPLTADRYPVGSWTLENVDITGADELKIEVTSYVNETKREYTITLQHECKDADFDGICDVCEKELGTIKTASVDYTAQMAGAFLSGPKSEVSVDSNLAELYGYTDKVSYLEGVSALDVLVKAHVDLYGESFTAAEKDSYLAVPETGYISKLFGKETSNNGFAVNRGYPNDGTESEYGGYNGTTVTTTSVSDGDLVEFFGYRDDWSSDNYTFTSVPETVAAGETFTANVKGISFGWMGYNYQTPEALKAAAKAIEGISIAAVNAETGAAADLEVTTDEEGNVSLRFDEPGEYLITAYGTDDTDTPVIMTLTKVTVTEAAVLPGDVNGDGSIMADDAAFAYAIANGDRKADQTQFTAADVNEDGVVDASDAAQIYGYANGNIKDFVKSENNDGKEKE